MKTYYIITSVVFLPKPIIHSNYEKSTGKSAVHWGAFYKISMLHSSKSSVFKNKFWETLTAKWSLIKCGVSSGIQERKRRY
jgi:hypothetical protein